jgi:hypothetical protein
MVRPTVRSKRTAKPPLSELHKWAATAAGHAPTEHEAIEHAYRDLQTFLIQHSVEVHGRIWIDSSELSYDVSNRFTGYIVVLKCRVTQRLTRAPRITV